MDLCWDNLTTCLNYFSLISKELGQGISDLTFESCTFILATKALHLAQAFFVEASGIPAAGFARMSVSTSQICMEQDQYGVIVSVAAKAWMEAV